MKPSKIIQIAMAQSEEACIDELFLDDNGKVWSWEYSTEKTTEYPAGAIPNEHNAILQKTYSVTRRRLVEVRMDTEWQNCGKHFLNQQWVSQDNGEQ